MMNENSAFEIAQAAIKQASATSKLRNRLRRGNKRDDEARDFNRVEIRIVAAALVAFVLLLCCPDMNAWRLKHGCPTYCTSSENKAAELLSVMRELESNMRRIDLPVSVLKQEPTAAGAAPVQRGEALGLRPTQPVSPSR
jgi:hypothetical protein